MKIVLAIENSKRKSVLFISDDGQIYTLNDAVGLVRSGELAGLQVANRNGVEYLRASRRRVGIPALQDVSISASRILSIGSGTTTVFSQAQFRPFWDFYQDQLDAEAQKGKLVVSVDGQKFDTIDHVRATLVPLKEYIFSAAEMFRIDRYLLAGILIDEIVRLAPFEEARDKLVAESLKLNVSVGVGQVMLDTARDLVANGYYNPNPDDSNLRKETVRVVSRAYLYPYVADNKHNVHFSAAHIRVLVDEWKSKAEIDISPEIIATLYSLRHIYPHENPKSNIRGEQIVGEFYPLAKKLLEGL